MSNEPYKDAHRPWEPNSIDQVFEYINLAGVKSDPELYFSVQNLINRGIVGQNFTYTIMNMCHSADAILIHVMRDVQNGHCG